MGNQFLAKVREVDGVVHLLRVFEAEVAHVSGNVDPLRDMEIIRTELALSDLEVIERRLDKLTGAGMREDKGASLEKETRQKVQAFISGDDLEGVMGWI